jgi:hypothetical protein
VHQALIDSFLELERAAADCFWKSENREAWRDDLLRLRETQNILPLKTQFDLSESAQQKQKTRDGSILLWDSDLIRCLTTSSPPTSDEDSFRAVVHTLSGMQKHTLTGLFLRPGFWMQPTWPEQEFPLRTALSRARENGAFIIRCGFLTQASDILWAADLGFSGIQIHAQGLDLFELQLAIELARDCRLSPVVSVSSFAELELVLQTDAPHIALCHLSSTGKGSTTHFMSEGLSRIPKNCSRLVIATALPASEIRALGKSGLDAALFFTTAQQPTTSDH